jgi:hypothetical protein
MSSGNLPITLSADNVIGLFSFMNPTSRRVFRSGELLNDQTAGSAADVQRQAAARFTNQVEARSDRIQRQTAEEVVASGRVTDPNHGSRQLASFQIPTAIRA